MRAKKKVIFCGLLCFSILLAVLLMINHDNHIKYHNAKVTNVTVTKDQKILKNCKVIYFAQTHSKSNYHFHLKIQAQQETVLSMTSFYLITGYDNPTNQFESFRLNNSYKDPENMQFHSLKLHKGLNDLQGTTQKDPHYTGAFYLAIKSYNGNSHFKNYLFKKDFH